MSTKVSFTPVDPLIRNTLIRTDSYKGYHNAFMPPDLMSTYSYTEARKSSIPGVDYSVVFGPQAWLMGYGSRKITRDDVEEVVRRFDGHAAFDRAPWDEIVEHNNGDLPIIVSSIPEGSVVPLSTPLVSVETTGGKKFKQVGQYLETQMLRAIWYPTTIATLSFEIKRIFKSFMEATCEDLTLLPFMLHDFGGRGVTCGEQAGLGGMSHLVSFRGTDTVEGLEYAERFYGERQAGYSVYALEHGVVLAWGKERELECFRNALRVVKEAPGTNKILSIIVDTFNDDHAIRQYICKDMHDEIIASGVKVVVRLDSGDAETKILKYLGVLGAAFGVKPNKKGYNELNPCVGMLWGDGLNRSRICDILHTMKINHWAANQVVMGMGGGLLQKMIRDDLGFAQKTSSFLFDDSPIWQGRSKEAEGKVSKAGRFQVRQEGQRYKWYQDTWRDNEAPYGEPVLLPIWSNGEFVRMSTFAEIRARADATLATMPSILMAQ